MSKHYDFSELKKLLDVQLSLILSSVSAKNTGGNPIDLADDPNYQYELKKVFTKDKTIYLKEEYLKKIKVVVNNFPDEVYKELTNFPNKSDATTYIISLLAELRAISKCLNNFEGDLPLIDYETWPIKEPDDDSNALIQYQTYFFNSIKYIYIDDLFFTLDMLKNICLVSATHDQLLKRINSLLKIKEPVTTKRRSDSSFIHKEEVDNRLLQHIKDCLEENNLIEPNTDLDNFLRIFAGREVKTKIRWIGKVGELKLLVNILVQYKIINRPKGIWQTTTKLFYIPAIKNLSNSLIHNNPIQQTLNITEVEKLIQANC